MTAPEEPVLADETGTEETGDLEVAAGKDMTGLFARPPAW